MYPHPDLSRLAAHKTDLRRRITARREACCGLAVRVSRPLAWLDQGVALWRRVAPFARHAVIPLALLLKLRAAPRPGLPGALVRWAPLVLGAWRALTAARRP